MPGMSLSKANVPLGWVATIVVGAVSTVLWIGSATQAQPHAHNQTDLAIQQTAQAVKTTTENLDALVLKLDQRDQRERTDRLAIEKRLTTLEMRAASQTNSPSATP